MVLFTILLLALAVLGAVVLAITGVIGGATLVVFGDLVVFVFIIMLISRLFRRKK